jgi:tRNA pseudouridine55 synthase
MAVSRVIVPDWVVLLDKPVGPTSFDMVRAARRGTRGRVGHAGTLDPFASGLLLLMTGAATRVSSLLMGLPKEYDLLVQFGATSTTGDPTGIITKAGCGDATGSGAPSAAGVSIDAGVSGAAGGPQVKAWQVVEVLDGFRGRITQRVPLTSAVKVGGEALYKKAHRGETVETPEREVTVYDLTLVDFDEAAQTARLLALVGSGTYARSLAMDIGAALGCGGYAAALRRTRIGPFSVLDALVPGDLSPERYAQAGRGLLTLDQALGFIPGRELSDADARLAANGNELRGLPAGRLRVHGQGHLLGVYAGDGERSRPLVVFPGAA